MGLAPTGRRVAVEDISIDRWAGDRIIETWIAYDVLSIVQQRGAARLPAAPWSASASACNASQSGAGIFADGAPLVHERRIGSSRLASSRAAPSLPPSCRVPIGMLRIRLKVPVGQAGVPGDPTE
jgi:hypothetical protein